MPSSATITSFYTFTGGNRARSSEVNSNFGNLRGHIFPVDPTITAGSNNTYDLGSSEYRWRTAYAQIVDISITTTAAMTIEGGAGGSMDFKVNGTRVLAVNDSGLVAVNATPRGITTSAVAGLLARSASINTTITSAGHIAGSTCTIVTVGRPVMLGVNLVALNTNISYLEAFKAFFVGVYTAAEISNINFHFVRDGLILPGVGMGVNYPTFFWSQKYPVGAFNFVDTPGGGTHTYALYISGFITNTGLLLSNIRVEAYEF